MIRSFPFDAVLDSSGIPDRVYLSIDFARYFAKFISNGVFPNPSTGLQVVAVDNNMQVRIKKGDGYIEGRVFENTDDYIFKLESADGVLNRIDRIVLRLDYLKRDTIPVLKKGSFASNPTAPVLQRDADAYEIALADVYIRAGAISITQANITDLRLNKELCGIVHGVVEQVDTTAIFNQFQSWYSQTKQAYDADMATWTTNKKQAFDNWTTSKENDYNNWTQEKKEAFNTWYNVNTAAFLKQFTDWYGANTTKWTNDFSTWFATIKGQLDGDIAAKLTVKTVELENKISTLSGVSGEKEKLNKGEFDSFKTATTLSLAEKASTTHNHSGVYEPVLSPERKRKITFGTLNPVGGADGDIYFQYE